MLLDSGIVVHTSPRDMRAELPSRRAIVHHGGLSTTHVAIETGTPQLVLPNSAEQMITGQRLVDLRLGLGLSLPQRTEGSVAEALRTVVSNSGLLARARVLRNEAAVHGVPSALSILLKRCNALLAAA